MFEEFSGGYYLGRLYVEPDEGAATAMCSEQHQQITEYLYGEDAPDSPDRPLVVKLGSRHLAVRGEAGVPAGTLAVPEAILADTPVDNPPTLSEVLLAKADRARQLLRLSGAGRAPGDERPDEPTGI